MSIDNTLVATARACAGIRSYMTNMPDVDPDFVINTYHQLVNVEAFFRMSNTTYVPAQPFIDPANASKHT